MYSVMFNVQEYSAIQGNLLSLSVSTVPGLCTLQKLTVPVHFQIINSTECTIQSKVMYSTGVYSTVPADVPYMSVQYI